MTPPLVSRVLDAARRLDSGYEGVVAVEGDDDGVFHIAMSDIAALIPELETAVLPRQAKVNGGTEKHVAMLTALAAFLGVDAIEYEDLGGDRHGKENYILRKDGRAFVLKIRSDVVDGAFMVTEEVLAVAPSKERVADLRAATMHAWRCIQPVYADGHHGTVCGRDKDDDIHPTGAHLFCGGEIGRHIPHVFRPASDKEAS